ncbi:hypothetical protein [Thalassospira sp. CH_XMU1420-2]|uniref:hypothetical protein n=1 Tax=Thalassospira sp. CH_XMU1420-2 TaxID=3107769 RepID=UPI001B1E686C|nr:hypothetical protein [Thalassospira sp.]
MTNQLHEGGLSWEDVPAKLVQAEAGTPANNSRPAASTPPIEPVPKATENIGPQFLSLYEQELNEGNFEKPACRWREIEQDWLSSANLSSYQARDLLEWLPALNEEAVIGRADNAWVLAHQKAVHDLINQANNEAREVLIALQKQRSELIEEGRNALLAFVTAANSERKLLVSWVTLVKRIKPDEDALDMSAFLSAAEGSCEKVGTLALCLLQEVSPAMIDIPAPTITTARAFLALGQKQSETEFLCSTAPAEYLSRFDELRTEPFVEACIEAAQRHMKQLAD